MADSNVIVSEPGASGSPTAVLTVNPENGQVKFGTSALGVQAGMVQPVQVLDNSGQLSTWQIVARILKVVDSAGTNISSTNTNLATRTVTESDDANSPMLLATLLQNVRSYLYGIGGSNPGYLIDLKNNLLSAFAAGSGTPLWQVLFASGVMAQKLTDLSGTPGTSGTGNTPMVRCALSAGNKTFTLTNSLAVVGDVVDVTLETVDGTLTQILNASVTAPNTIVINGNANATGTTKFTVQLQKKL